ncbi:MAG: hypothetical protein OXL68_10705 [Paracoccaceae bacterium]|nr:hypothetical protein [Paracoccaceae bacterium]
MRIQNKQPTIVTMKWGSAYSSHEVNVLFRAVTAHTSGHIDFVCMTDNPDGLDPKIKKREIPLSGLNGVPDEWMNLGGVWPKICLYHPDLNEEFRQVLFLDIDMVIVGNIDPLLADPGDKLVMLNGGKGWKFRDERLAPEPMSSVLSFQPRFHVDIFEQFAANPRAAMAQFSTEQEFVGYAAGKIGFFPLTWTESFKYHLRRYPVVDMFVPPKRPKESTQIVVFHGFPNPSHVVGDGTRWSQFPRVSWRRPRWLQDYWERYSVP